MVRESGCDMLTDLPLEQMSRDAIVSHLRECKCPTLRRLKNLL